MESLRSLMEKAVEKGAQVRAALLKAQAELQTASNNLRHVQVMRRGAQSLSLEGASEEQALQTRNLLENLAVQENLIAEEIRVLNQPQQERALAQDHYMLGRIQALTEVGEVIAAEAAAQLQQLQQAQERAKQAENRAEQAQERAEQAQEQAEQAQARAQRAQEQAQQAQQQAQQQVQQQAPALPARVKKTRKLGAPLEATASSSSSAGAGALPLPAAGAGPSYDGGGEGGIFSHAWYEFMESDVGGPLVKKPRLSERVLSDLCTPPPPSSPPGDCP